MQYIENISDWLNEKPLLHRLGLLAAIVILLSGAYWYFYWSPNEETISRLERSLQSKQRTLAELENIAQDLPQFEEQFEKLSAEFEEASLKLPKEEEIPALINSIYSDVSAAGLDPQVFAPRSQRPMQIYAEIPIEMKVVGSYHQLANFFDRISRLPRIVNVQDLRLQRHRQLSTAENIVLEADFTTVSFRILAE